MSVLACTCQPALVEQPRALCGLTSGACALCWALQCLSLTMEWASMYGLEGTLAVTRKSVPWNLDM